MGQKQTAPQSEKPVFSFTGTSATSNSPLGGPSVTSPNEPGTLGADTLSTGANVSRTMDNLNSRDQSTHGGLAFAKHRFDKIDPKTGDILLTPDTPKKKQGLFSGLFGRKAAQPESVSMIENRHKDVVIPEEYQNPGRKKRGKAAAQPAPAPAAPADPVVPATPAASTQPAAPAQPMPAPAQPALASSTQPAPQAAPASQPAAPKKSRKGIIIALAGVAVVAAAIVAVVLVSNVMNSGSNKGGNTTNTANNSSSQVVPTNSENILIEKIQLLSNGAEFAEYLISSINNGSYNLAMLLDNADSTLNTINELSDNLDELSVLVNQELPNSELNQILQSRVPGYKNVLNYLAMIIGYYIGDSEQTTKAETYIGSNQPAAEYVRESKSVSYTPNATQSRELLMDGVSLADAVAQITAPIDYSIEGSIADAIDDVIHELEGE